MLIYTGELNQNGIEFETGTVIVPLTNEHVEYAIGSHYDNAYWSEEDKDYWWIPPRLIAEV